MIQKRIGNDTPKFPCFDITFCDETDFNSSPWVDSLIIFEDVFYASKRKFKKYLFGHIVVDSNGNKFQAHGMVLFNRWRLFIPIIAKGNVLYSSLDEFVELDEIKKLYIKKVLTIKSDQAFVSEWIKQINDALSYEEVYFC